MNRIVFELQQIIGPIHNLLLLIFGVVIAVLAFGTVLAALGVRANFLPTIPPLTLVYLAGAHFLLRGGKL